MPPVYWRPCQRYLQPDDQPNGLCYTINYLNVVRLVHVVGAEILICRRAPRDVTLVEQHKLLNNNGYNRTLQTH